jgi:glycine oxidase
VRVLILGAGIIGASIAERLATGGADVTVLDMRSPGRGASQASAGILAPYIEAHAGSPLLALCARSLGLFDDWIARISTSSERQIEYSRAGTLELAFDDGDRIRLEASRRWLVDQSVDAEWIDAAGMRDREPTVSAEATGGLLIPTHGLAGVESLITALVQSARLAGAAFMSPVEAGGVEQRADTVTVRAGDRTLSADIIVIAAGSWSRRVRVAGVAALPIRPVRGQLVHLRWSDEPRPSRVIWGPGCYAVPWSDGSLLVGATVEDVGFDESSTVAGVQSLLSAVTRILPAAARARLDQVRVGLRPATPDELPMIGPLARAPRVIVATGHYRNGILLAPLTAELVARHVLDGETLTPIEI